MLWARCCAKHPQCWDRQVTLLALTKEPMRADVAGAEGHAASHSQVFWGLVRVPSGGLSTMVLAHSTDSSHGVGLRLWRCNTSTVQRQQFRSAAQNGRDELMLRHCSPLFLTNASGWYGLHRDTPCVSPLCLVFPVNAPHTFSLGLVSWLDWSS